MRGYGGCCAALRCEPAGLGSCGNMTCRRCCAFIAWPLLKVCSRCMHCSSTPAVVLPFARQYDAALAAASFTTMPALCLRGGSCSLRLSMRVSQCCLTLSFLLLSAWFSVALVCPVFAVDVALRWLFFVFLLTWSSLMMRSCCGRGRLLLAWLLLLLAGLDWLNTISQFRMVTLNCLMWWLSRGVFVCVCVRM